MCRVCVRGVHTGSVLRECVRECVERVCEGVC